MKKLIEIWKKHREALTYLIFGGLTTVVNIGLFMLLSAWTELGTGAANAIALVSSILFAYVTNKLWVFESRLGGWAAVKEFGMFIACRATTGLLDQGIVVLGVDWLGASLGLDGNPIWAGGVKLFANVLVIIANYVFSKVWIFRRK